MHTGTIEISKFNKPDLSGKGWIVTNVAPPKFSGMMCSASNGTQAKNQPVSSRYKQFSKVGVWKPLSERRKRSGW
jgi:hypothetical protein